MRIAASNEDDGTRGAKSSGPKRTSKLQGLDAAAAEAARAHAGSPANTLGPVTVLEHITYGLENRIAANPNYPFILLIVNSAVVIGAAGVGWHLLAARVSDAEVFGFDSWWDGIYLAANVVMTGGPDTYHGYGLAWANASNTPFREYKHWVHEGGISSPLIAHWPSGIGEKRHGKLESQPGHLIDLMATCVDLGQAAYPEKVGDTAIVPMQGTSLAPAFKGKKIMRKKPIYWEHEGNRAMLSIGWETMFYAVW